MNSTVLIETVKRINEFRSMIIPNFKLVEFDQFKIEFGADTFTFQHLLGNSVSLKILQNYHKGYRLQ
jgi:hypothetical protein